VVRGDGVVVRIAWRGGRGCCWGGVRTERGMATGIGKQREGGGGGG